MKKSTKRGMSVVASFLVAYTAVSNLLPNTPVKARNAGNVQVQENANSLVIGNDFITREFSLENGNVSTSKIVNSRIAGENVEFIPGENSENFVINTITEIPEGETIVPTQKLDTTGWTAVGINGEDASVIFDGDSSTKWEAPLNSANELIIDMQEPKTFKSFSYQARQDGFKDNGGIWGINGIIKGFEIHTSDDGQNWTKVKEGDFDIELYDIPEENKYNRSNPAYINFDEAITTQHIKLVSTSQYNGGNYAITAAEVGVYEDELIKPEGPVTAIKSSDLVLEENGVIQENIENGVKITFDFKPHTLNNIEWDINYVVEMNNGDHFMKTFMEISVPDSQQATAKIDYIDTDDFVVTNEASMQTAWSRPDDMSSQWIRPEELSLGQPIYLEGMFFGSEFPAADTDLKNNEFQIRYYSGKSFDNLEKTADGKFITWESVVGAARSKDHAVVQADLFDYIDTIATKTKFRKQYNSWYDHMMDIDEQNIQDSFYEIEKGLTEVGVEPLDSYVVDDGWNAYEGMSGNTPSKAPFDNKSGFWEFNNKFPNELYPAKSLSSRMDSKFGLWLGPRGGYNYNDGFGKYLEYMGTGYYNQNGYMNDVCVGSGVYQDKLLDLFLDYQERFDLNYWKLDGFALRPCSGEDHGHMTGGENQMYFTTELWERWTDMFEDMREQRVDIGKDMWINLTCYANPSPWFLQWVNTVWLQDCGDNGFIDTIQGGENHGTPLNGNDADQQLTYRDDVYHNLFERKDLQFPLKNVYNHDPIYGNTASNFITGERVNMTDDEFRYYMYGNAVRGTAFWELYFSYNMMSEGKWMITGEVLDWAENNFNVLEKAKQIGGNPGNGEVYGYSAWNDGKGIVSIRNPRDIEQTFEITLDNVAGVPEDMTGLVRKQVIPYVTDAVDSKSWTYGDTLSITLKPHETLIFEFGEEDAVAPSIELAKNHTNDTLRIRFDEAIAIDENSFEIAGQKLTGTLLHDYRTVEIAIPEGLANDTEIAIDVKDLSGNRLTTTTNLEVYTNQIITSVDSKDELKDGKKIEEVLFEKAQLNMLRIDDKYELNTNDSVNGNNDFAVSMVVRTDSTNTTLLEQEGGYKLSIDNDGFLNFEINGVSVNSKLDETIKDESGNFVAIQRGQVNDTKVRLVNAVREANGMLKLYIDGELIASKHDASVEEFELQNSKTFIGDTNFNGLIADVNIFNSALGFDDATDIYESLNITDNQEISRENWTAIADSEHAGTHEGPAQNAIDGDLGTWWHTSYGLDMTDAPHHITIDMGKATEFNRFEYVSRNGNGDIKDYVLEVSNDGESWTTISKGTWERERSTLVEFEDVTARYIRLNANETYGTPANKFASAAELKAYKYDESADYTVLFDVISKAKTYTPDGYTEESFANLTGALENALAIRDNFTATQAQVDSAIDSLRIAIDGLEISTNIKVSKVKNFKGISTSNSVALTWEKPKHSAGLVEYIIYKDGKEFTRIDADTLECNVEELKSNFIYNFKILAVYSNDKQSNPVSTNVRTKK